MPGLYSVPYEEYASWNAVRASALNILINRSLAHVKHEELSPAENTAAQELGIAFHAAILEPEFFKSEYVVAPKIDRRTRSGKEEWAAFVEKSAGKTPISAEDHLSATRAVEAMRGVRDVAELLSSSVAVETSAVWTDDVTGIMCKARIDLLTVFAGMTYIVDLKSTQDASKNSFQRQMTNYGYYRQLAFYRWGLDCIAHANRRCAIIAVEKNAPWCSAAYELDESALDVGMAEMRDALNKYADAVNTQTWPGYGHDISVIGLPAWRDKAVD